MRSTRLAWTPLRQPARSLACRSALCWIPRVPEIRTKTYKDGKIEIVEGQEFTLTTRDIEGDNTIVSITYEGLPNDVQPGTRILIDDGLVAFEVEEIKNGTDIVCKALNGGPLSNRKSINVPGIKLNMKFVSDN